MKNELWLNSHIGDLKHLNAGEALEALQDNLNKLDVEKQPMLWNITIALMYLVQRSVRVEKDVDLLHNKVDTLRTQ